MHQGQLMIQRPRFLAPVSPRVLDRPTAQDATSSHQQLFDQLHARICSRDYADDTDTRLALLSQELQIILHLLTERTLPR